MYVKYLKIMLWMALSFFMVSNAFSAVTQINVADRCTSDQYLNFKVFDDSDRSRSTKAFTIPANGRLYSTKISFNAGQILCVGGRNADQSKFYGVDFDGSSQYCTGNNGYTGCCTICRDKKKANLYLGCDQGSPTDQ